MRPRLQPHLPRALLLAVFALALAPLAGCPTGERCSLCGDNCQVSTTTPVAWTEQTALGSPEQLYSSFAGTCQAPFEWDASPWSGALAVVPRAGESTLSATVALDPTSARLV